MLEVSNRLNSAEDKNVPKALLEARYNFVDNKTNIKSSSLLKGSRLRLTSNELKDIIKVIKSLKNRGIILLKETTRKTTGLVKKEDYSNFLVC